MTKRIANLVGEAGKDWGYDVPEWAVSPGFTSEIFPVPMLWASPLNPLESSMSDFVYAEAGLRALDEGYDALVINSADDVGLQYLRAATTKPVVGCGLAAMQMALGFGQKFAILTVFPPTLRPQYERIVRDYGFEDFFAGTWFMSETEEGVMPAHPLVLEMRAGTGSVLLDRGRAMAREAVAEGVDAIVLGCTCMSPARAGIQDGLPVPVIDPLVAGHQLAETLVTMNLTHPEPPVGFTQRTTFDSMVRGSGVGETPVQEFQDALCGDTCDDLQAEGAAYAAAQTANRTS